MKLAVVILNWNGKELLETFLPSVVKHSQNATIYVADNASTDASLAFIRTHYPSVKIIENKSNGGYAKGYNDALKHVEEPLFCLLNSDVEVTENWLTPIINTFKAELETAIIQPKILDYKKKSHFEYAGAAGGFIDKYGYPYCRGRLFNTIEADTNQYNDTTPVFWASGACFFIRKEVFSALNGFDESFFAHMEEIDLCWRAYNLNYKTKYVGTSTVYHVGGATLNAINPKKTYLNFRNSLFCLSKNASGNLFALIFVRLVFDGFAALKFLVDLKPKHILAILQAHFSFYRHLSTLLKKRTKSPQIKNYYTKNSIVWLYFAQKKRYYRDL
ncbi:glycosyltransferase family 2 protein [Bizionia gelidisalsuginis]|uniref:Glycosyltransferase family 2 protein n=1 Tax=Bizionia gelidisalsuginis TaxID=291188 RepID=A0ABY3MEP7_9FLAO|nr:glycosyltransferase family 2 protein [Bizionia gelidisalsuginis]TYC18015.1 glycosyltransferase family 2 protein [Bizionia gelidisalsuginis]